MTVVDDYLHAVPAGPNRDALERLVALARAELPGAEEVTSYNLPAFRVNGKAVLGFAANTRFLSLYPFSGSIGARLGDLLEGFEQTKGSIHFTPEHPLPDDTVRAIIAMRLADIG